MTIRLRNCSPVLVTIFCLGCSASEPAPINRITQADLAIRAAVDAKAADLAPIELQSARDKLAQARKMMAAENYTEARRLAASAQVDAELAEAKAETTVMRRAADQILRGAYKPPTEAERESRKPLTSEPAAKDRAPQ